jgi:hypothetical protein
MMEVNLRGMETTSGERQEFWIVAIKATWVAVTLTRQHDKTMHSHTVGEGS